MIVSTITPLNKKKLKISTYDGIEFALYTGEAGRFLIEPDTEIDDMIYYKEIFPLLFKRCKEKAAYILKLQDKSEFELRSKLKSAYYPDEVIDKTIAWTLENRYINDERYAAFIVMSGSDKRSKKELYIRMKQKGIAEDVILKAIDDACIDEEKTVREILKKKHYDRTCDDIKIKSKMISYLTAKGFSFETVKKCIQEDN